MAEEAGFVVPRPDPDAPSSCGAAFCDYMIGGGLLSTAMAILGILAVRLGSTWDDGFEVEDKCLELASLRAWLQWDGWLAILMGIPGLYAVICCGTAHGLNKCLFLPALALLIWGVVIFYNEDELDWSSSTPTTTTTTTSTTTTTGTAIDVIVIKPCQGLKLQAGLILLAQCLAPLALCNYVVSILGGAGLISGFLSFPAAIALCTAVLQWDAQCQQPLAKWMLMYGLVLSLVPGLFFCCSGMDKEVVTYARLKQRARDEKSEYPVDSLKEEKLSACAQHVNSCLCIPTVVLLVVGFWFRHHTSDVTCDPTLRWWTRVVLILTAISPVLGACCTECCDTRSSGIPGACWDPVPTPADPAAESQLSHVS